VRAAETRNYRETKRVTKIRESIEVGRELHSKASQPRRACKNVLNTDLETVKTTAIIIIIIIIVDHLLPLPLPYNTSTPPPQIKIVKTQIFLVIMINTL